MAVLAVQRPTPAGVALTYAAAAAGGDDALVSSRTFAHVKNGGASPITVTVTGTGGVTPVVIAAGSDAMISLLLGASIKEGSGHANTGSGKVRLTYSAVTSVTVAVIST